MNPILEKSSAPFGAPRFDLIKNEHFLPAFEEAIKLGKAEIDTIASNPDAPTFANTVVTLEYAGRALSDVEEIFFNLLEAESDSEMQKIAEEVSPKLTEFGMYVSLNEKLFARVKTVYENEPESLGVSERKLLEDTYKGFIRSGAALMGEARGRYASLCEELSLLELRFGNNVLSATNAYVMHITDENDLEGLPSYLLDAGRQNAEERSMDGWVFTLNFPDYSPFMKYSGRRELRKKMYMEYNSRCLSGAYDNTGIISRIIEIRAEIAGLLGYGSYAEYALEHRMAKNALTVERFLNELMEPSLPCARKEMDDLEAFAKSNGFDDDRIRPWDFPYWSERLRKADYNFDEQLLKPYFRLEDCISAVFSLAGRLYGISFEERADIPVYHRDVKVYDVRDGDGEHLALFYADSFPRAGKRGGAWMTSFREQYMEGDTDYRPFISIVTNFTKPAAGVPSLITHREFETLLHEFGHALHGMLSRGRYPSQCGTNVARDFVELPSQIMENWAYEKEFLQSFARHYVSGEPIPEDFIDKIAAAKNFQSGYQQVRQLHFGILDMAWHTAGAADGEGLEEFEKRILGPYATLPHMDGTAVSPSFSHIFSGGYSAGYYSYKWAEVLEADAFALFAEKGVFSREVAESFRKNILERGSSEDEDVLYRNFRGRDPQAQALLEKLGIVSRSAPAADTV